VTQPRADAVQPQSIDDQARFRLRSATEALLYWPTVVPGMPAPGRTRPGREGCSVWRHLAVLEWRDRLVFPLRQPAGRYGGERDPAAMIDLRELINRGALPGRRIEPENYIGDLHVKDA
jgi:hypothetical protein